MQLRVRGMKVKEEKILTDRKLAKSGEQLDRLLSVCATELVDPGPYKFQQIDWGRVLQGDRFFVLLQIREESYGHDYAFSVNCDNRNCRERFEWEIDTRELVVKPLSPDITDIYAPISVMLPSASVEVKFHLGIGADEARARRLAKGNETSPLTIGLLSRIDQIQGIDNNDPRATAKKRTFIEELEMSDLTFIRSKFEEFDCGIETGIDIECPECGSVMHIELPLAETFFMPRTKKRDAGSCPAVTPSNG